MENVSQVNFLIPVSTHPPFQNGWPVTVGGLIDSNPALGDLDNDGDLEVIFGSFDTMVYAFHHNGTPVNGWPRSLETIVAASPTLINLESNGNPKLFL